MPGQIGSDEAGYGPNLGPLTITGTLWSNSGSQDCLYEALDKIVKRSPSRLKDSRLTVADSKVVYKSSGSIQHLESTVLSFLIASENSKRRLSSSQNHGNPFVAYPVPRTIRDLIHLACPTTDWPGVQTQPGFAMQEIELPLKACPSKIENCARVLEETMEDSSVRLQQTICRPVFANEFNSALATLGNKATLLSETTLDIISALQADFDDDLEIVCDKHGGRNHYASLIQSKLTDQPVSIGLESRQCSDYFFSEGDRDVAIHFQAGGESFMPTALASMVSKYLREVIMVAWNRFWINKIPTLKPTKGYPVDAKRFKAEIHDCQKQLGISDHDIWRMR